MSYKLWIDVNYKNLTKKDFGVIADALNIPLPPIKMTKKSLHTIIVNEITTMNQIDKATRLHFGIQDMKSCVSSKFTVKKLKMLWVNILKQDLNKLNSKKKNEICNMILDLLAQPFYKVKVMVNEQKEQEEKVKEDPSKTYINKCMTHTVKQIKKSQPYQDIPKTYGKSKLKKHDLCKLLAKLTVRKVDILDDKKEKDNVKNNDKKEKDKQHKQFNVKNNHKKWCYNDSDFVTLDDWEDIKASDIIIIFEEGQAKGSCYSRKSLLTYMKKNPFYYWDDNQDKEITYRLIDKIFTYFVTNTYKLLQNKKLNVFAIRSLPQAKKYTVMNKKNIFITKSKLSILTPLNSEYMIKKYTGLKLN